MAPRGSTAAQASANDALAHRSGADREGSHREGMVTAEHEIRRIIESAPLPTAEQFERLRDLLGGPSPLREPRQRAHDTMIQAAKITVHW